MRISIFGLGYVGCVSAACFANEGHDVIGVDVNKKKVDLINEGKSPIIEEGVEELISKTAKNKSLRATIDVKEAMFNTEISFLCVGTPSRPNGSINYDIVEKTCLNIGQALKTKKSSHIIVIRSTILPGCMGEVIIPALEKGSNKKEGRDFYIYVNPEFLREGTSINDFYNPPFVLIGVGRNRRGPKELRDLYKNINAEYIETTIEISEMIKYTCNAFHALKIVFANEIGSICKVLNIDSHEVMNIVCKDKKLNISSKYLKPGFAFGGSCLPKDLRAMTYKAKEKDINVPLLNSLLPSNIIHFNKVVDFILSLNKKKIGIVGLSFKAGTDDLRESPNVTLAETLMGKGLEISIYDKNVLLAKLFGANKEYIEKQMPHISKLMKSSLGEVLNNSEVIILGNKGISKEKIVKYTNKNHIVFDLVRLFKTPAQLKARYFGVCW